MIRNAAAEDGREIAGIYNYYVANTTITFEESVLTGEEMGERIASVLGEGLPWFVYEEDGKILGYAYASRWKSRCAYRFSVETSVYLSKDCLGRGMGKELYLALIGDLKKQNYHSVIGGVALPNPRSQKLHESLGFKKVAQFEQVGYKRNRWIDVGYWQLNLELPGVPE